MNYLDVSIANTTWADAYGVWHACVPDTGNPRKNAAAARKLIMASLVARSNGVDLPVFSITLKRTTDHDTVIYGEKV
jgi:hypothetical protein